ncbi:MAG TPA: hypothetical protein VMX97_10470 [Hyphomicrobiaceae bacterium]|nr:hypothetical protein [Hyphomicrobiaceae bacterium]
MNVRLLIAALSAFVLFFCTVAPPSHAQSGNTDGVQPELPERNPAPQKKRTAQQTATPWYGKPSDVAYAEELWQALLSARMVGPKRIKVAPAIGKQPHATIQQVLARRIMIGGRKARAIVKANHRKKGATLAQVRRNPNAYLMDYTVMLKRQPGYDPPNKDWFWVLYRSDGTTERDGSGTAIAGRVDSPSGNGCAACHRKVGGSDLEALTER